MHNLAKNAKFIRLQPDDSGYGVTAGTSDVTSEYIDMLGFEEVTIVTGFGAITSTAVTSVKVQQCDTSGGSYADLASTSISVADDDDNQMTVHSIYRPKERYLKVVTDRGTANAVIDFQIAILCLPTNAPPTHDSATVVSAEYFNSPAEGTA